MYIYKIIRWIDVFASHIDGQQPYIFSYLIIKKKYKMESCNAMIFPGNESDPTVKCSICDSVFNSRNLLFKHLSIHGYIGETKLEKVIILVGWIAPSIDDDEFWVKDGNLNHYWTEESDFVENSIWRAMNAFERKCDYKDAFPEKPKGFSRGSGCAQRASFLMSEESSCHGLCDVFCFLSKSFEGSNESWLEAINYLLPPNVRILDRKSLPRLAAGDFHAESSCTQRRYEYVLPLEVLFPDQAKKVRTVRSSERISSHQI